MSSLLDLVRQSPIPLTKREDILPLKISLIHVIHLSLKPPCFKNLDGKFVANGVKGF